LDAQTARRVSTLTRAGHPRDDIHPLSPRDAPKRDRDRLLGHEVVNCDRLADFCADPAEQLAKGLIVDVDVDRKAFYFTMDWLRERAFYLSAELCKRVNEANKTLDSRLEQEQREAPEGEAFGRQIFHELPPHEDMNDSYFL